MDPRELAGAVEVAFRAVREDVRRAFHAPPRDGERKDDNTVVTGLDRHLEERLGAALLALDGAFGLVGEEGGTIREGSPTWHLDPLDGTLNFARRISRFASQAVLLDGMRPLFAAVYEPLQDDFTWAADGAGTWREGRRVRVASRPPRDAVLLLDISKSGFFVSRPELLARVRRAVYRVRALGSIAVQLRDVASGAADGFLGSRSFASRLYDTAPGVLLVREAGGVATDAAGEDPLADRRTLLAASPVVHAALLPLLA